MIPSRKNTEPSSRAGRRQTASTVRRSHTVVRGHSTNDTSPPSSPRAKRNGWLQFGTRSLFVLIVLVAVAAWVTKREMSKEERREYWIVLLPAKNHPASSLQFAPNGKTPWSRHFVGWLRGKPPTRAVDLVSLRGVEDPATIRELIGLFPGAHFAVDFDQGAASPEFMEVIANIKTLDSIELRGLVDTSDEAIVRLGKVRPRQPFMMQVERIDDNLLRRIVDAKVHARVIYVSGQMEGAGWQVVTNEGLRLAAQLPKLDSVVACRKGAIRGWLTLRTMPRYKRSNWWGRDTLMPASRP